MTETEAKWKDRVQAWRGSGKTAEAFAADEDFEASTLRYWASRLKGELKVDPKVSGAAVSSAPSRVAMARVIKRGRPRSAAGSTVPAGGLELVVGGARIAVGRGFDPALLREVVLALGGAE